MVACFLILIFNYAEIIFVSYHPLYAKILNQKSTECFFFLQILYASYSHAIS